MNWIQKLIWGRDYANLGEAGFRFDPHWPGPFIGEAGAMANYAMGLCAIGLLILAVLWFRPEGVRPEPRRTYPEGFETGAG